MSAPLLSTPHSAPLAHAFTAEEVYSPPRYKNLIGGRYSKVHGALGSGAQVVPWCLREGRVGDKEGVLRMRVSVGVLVDLKDFFDI